MNGEITDQTGHAQAQAALPVQPDPRALNGVTHGMGSEHVPSDERTAYAAHVQAVRSASGATGYLEERLADRAALALWRLDRVARYEAAQSSTKRREVAGQLAGGVNPFSLGTAAKQAHDALEMLGRLTGESLDTLRSDPQAAEDSALTHEADAAYLEQIAAGGGAEDCTEDQAFTLGEAMGATLRGVRVSGASMVRAMTGRAPKRGEGASVENEEWTYEPEEMPGLLALYRERLGEYSGRMLQGDAALERQKAGRVREVIREVLSAQADALALAALPSEKELEKVTRYEAHLERVLYRALHDLEAARDTRAGRAAPPPLRGVLDERQE
ncbi:hypothetical protein [Deinococcus arenicola]|uniref:Uncharacterized protein n=1 Tax=Deinococcus arenicola TaxID=2994950 RepID=A0ABU4DUI9_9DEIO|nr:hypothetical protein [Deinococcus sp. ZS9-10]MDV6376096.1 hypothetical protein [Deinococcus sp. ZS9-10]